MRLCTKCKQPGEFYRDITKKDGIHSVCKLCHSTRNKARRKVDSEYRERSTKKSMEWRLANPEHSRFRVRDSTLKRKYGLTVDDYNKLLESQGGVCQVCKNPPTNRRLAVDHCHTTGKIRGLLCQACNVSIGKMRESPDLIRRLANYVEDHHQNLIA